MAESPNLNALNYTVLVPYNGTTPTGGDSMETDLNVFYNAGDIAWLITSTALVLLMIPGVGYEKSALSLIWVSIMSLGVVSFQWFFWGYSLAFSHSAGKYIGNLENFGFKNVLAQPSVGSSKVPDLLFGLYQGMFAAITNSKVIPEIPNRPLSRVALAVGAVAERGRMAPCVVFMFVWTTVIYDAIACWTWNPAGWVFKMGGLDFAGGTPVHIASGAAALAYSLMLGKRRGHGTQDLNYRPHNVTHVVIGTVFLWFGWFGFNAGSALSANLRAVMAGVVTNLAAAVGGVTWCLMDYRLERKFSAVGFSSGVISGLVAITPGSGYVPPWAAIIFGVVAAAACNYATQLKWAMRIDDSLDIFAVHGVGGFVGNLLTGLFAADYIARLDGVTHINGGWLNKHYIQLAYQLADSVSGAAYSFLGSCIILFLINLVPGLHLRTSEKDEILGVDDAEIGEFAYDYVERTRDLTKGFETDFSERKSDTDSVGREKDRKTEGHAGI
ncbi:hypothetical protein PRK78_001263 [Emydomyces testavorans]|uniref:Ammonium transporter n=1 Tax=Emydomyces testavorans TaxID=2070801 RepID=A0AAF0DCL6_9EURO|nr:hypothetical protein PRK78_001263 [Emydomyces testavorans]